MTRGGTRLEPAPTCPLPFLEGHGRLIPVPPPSLGIRSETRESGPGVTTTIMGEVSECGDARGAVVARGVGRSGRPVLGGCAIPVGSG